MYKKQIILLVYIRTKIVTIRIRKDRNLTVKLKMIIILDTFLYSSLPIKIRKEAGIPSPLPPT